MAYGMPWHRFEELYIGDCETHATLDHVRGVLEAADDALLTVGDTFYQERFYTSHVPSIWEKRILALTDTNGGRRHAEVGPAGDLIELVWNPAGDDDPQFVLFFPTLRHRRKWYRRNDPMDCAFDRWRGGTSRGDFSDWETFVKEVPWGHDPFENYLMLTDGTPEPWTHWRELIDRHDIVPAPPSEFRFWLPKLGILDDHGVNQLRPVIAQWGVS